ncbi:MAG: ABC transporter ATP-binding protein [Candidatus Bathyarchaeia archaeon]
MLKINNLDVFYGDLQVLYDVSAEVEKGELTVILGANGSGKTTLLKTIMGLLKPKRGLIYFEGSRIDGLSADEIVRRGITLVPEGRKLFPLMSVRENLELGAYASKEARRKLKDSIELVYSIFPVLKEREHQLAKTLSGGEQQMLAIGRALISRPKMLILDEPSLGLAPKLVISLFNSIKKINEQGVTILLVEQNARAAAQLAHSGYIMENGRIVAKYSRDRLLEEEVIRKAYMGG